MKKRFYPLMMAIALAAAACTNTTEDSTETVDPTGKTPISFSVEENHAATTRAAFGSETKIAMRIKSEKSGSTDVSYTRTVATASGSTGAYSTITIDGAYTRYWDDAYGRKANLSVFAIAVPGKTTVKNDGKTLEEKLTAPDSPTWFTETTENETLTWKVSPAQTATTLAEEDLTYSKNIQANGENGVYRYDFAKEKYPDYSDNLENGCMKFSQQAGVAADGPGKFDKGHLIFNHALSRITVMLKRGAGFATGTGSFNFTSGNVTVKNVPISGTLNLIDGTWDKNSITNGDITSMAAQKPDEGYDYKLMAQMLPDNVISSTTNTNVLSFIIDNNQYYITQAQMYTALKNAENASDMDANKVTSAGITMEQGLNYVFNITVKKTGIGNITATVQKWNDINAEEITPTNARITISGIYDSNGAASTGFSLYRAVDESKEISDTYEGKNWEKGYGTAATLTATSTGWDTNWYFESNKTYYHFRTVTGATPEASTTEDYFNISSGITDYHWGAPMTAAPSYDTENGYKAQLSSAIGATSSALNITDLHIMSYIAVKLQTTTTADKVDLSESKVYITNFAKDGTVLMGTGLVTPTETITDAQLITASGYYVVPQSLIRGTDPSETYVGLIIETKDGNQYVIKNLSTTLVKGSTTEKITRWLPGSSYTYTFTLKKSGITNLTCTVEGWKYINAENQDVTLE